MANNTYKNNITSFTEMQKYIDDSITIAEDMVDLAEIEIWQAKKEQLTSWIDGDGLVQDPMTDEDWKAAKVNRPVIIQETEVTTNEAVDSENELFEKNVVKQISEFQSALEKDEDPSVLAIEKFVEVALTKDNLTPMLEKDLNDLKKAAIKKRTEVTRILITKSETLNKVEARQQLERAKKEWNPGDKELDAIIQEKLNKLPIDVNSDTISFKLADIKQHEDYERFSGALYYLESLRYTYAYTHDQIQDIERERAWFDAKRIRDGQRTSMHMIGDLRQKRIELLKVERSPEPTYQYNGKEITYGQMHQICLQVWQDASNVLTQKEILKANKLKESSPNTARISLNRLLTETQAYSFDGKINEEINVFPLTLDHQKLIQEEIDGLKESCEKEDSALSQRKDGVEAKDAFIKLEKFLAARNYFSLPGIDHEIYAQLFPATRSRQISLQSSMESIKNRLDNAKIQNEVTFRNEIDAIQIETKELITKTSSWPHIGEKIQNRQGNTIIELTIDFPDEIKELQIKAQELQVKVNDHKAALEFFIKERNEILDGLGEKETRNDAIAKWKSLSQTPLLSEFRIFNDFGSVMNNQTTVKDNLDVIHTNIQGNNWITALTNCRELQNTKEYQHADASTKEEVARLLTDCEMGFHKTEFTRAFSEKNYLGAQYELDWLKSNGSVDDQFAEQKLILEKIEQNGAELEAFYRKTLHDSGITNEILARVHSSKQRFLQRYFDNPDSQAADIVLIKKMIDEKTREIILEIYLKELSKAFDRLAFSYKCKTLKKINYIASGVSSDDIADDYPRFTQSFATYDADWLFKHLSDLLRSSIIDFITSLKINEIKLDNLSTVKEKFDAYHDFNFRIDEDVYQTILVKEYQLTKLIEKGKKLSERNRLWIELQKRFPDDERIKLEWKSVKKESYIEQIDQLIVAHKFAEAHNVIKTAMNDESVGACSEMYQRLIRVSTESESSVDISTKVAWDALEKVQLWGASPDEIKRLSTRIRIAEIYEANSENHFGNLILLAKLFTDQNLDQTILTKRFKERYDPYIKETETEIRRLRLGSPNEQREAIHLLLMIHQLDIEYTKIFNKNEQHVGEYISDMAPLLFADGRRLLNEANVEITKARRPSVTQSLETSITATALLSSQVDSFIKFVSEMAETNGENLVLSTLVKKVITLHVPTNQQALKLEDLKSQISDAESDPKLSEFNSKKRDLDAETTSLKTLLELYKKAVQVELWEKGAGNRLYAKDPSAWTQLAQQVAVIRDEKRLFAEIVLLTNSFQDWDLILNNAADICNKLKENFQAEEFDQAEKLRKSYIAIIESLPKFDDDFHKPEEAKTYLLEAVSIFDEYSAKTIHSVTGIEEVLNNKKGNLQIWERSVNEITADWNIILDKTSTFLMKMDEFKAILTNNETVTLKNYLIDIEKISTLTTEKSRNARITLPPGLIIEETAPAAPEPAPRSIIQKARGLLNQGNNLENEKTILRLKRYLNKSDPLLDEADWNKEQSNPLAYDLNDNVLNHDNYQRIKYQLAFFSSILNFGVSKSGNYESFLAKTLTLSSRAEEKASEYKVIYDHVTTEELPKEKFSVAMRLYQVCQKDSISLVLANPLKEQKWFEIESNARRWNNMVKEICSKEIFATRIDIERYRLNLISQLSKG